MDDYIMYVFCRVFFPLWHFFCHTTLLLGALPLLLLVFSYFSTNRTFLISYGLTPLFNGRDPLRSNIHNITYHRIIETLVKSKKNIAIIPNILAARKGRANSILK